MVALKGKSDIGDQINKKIIAPLANANKLSDMPDFNDANKLGSGKEMVDRLTNLIAIFENRALDFSRNRADGDDILGDAYEYLIGTSPPRVARARASSTPPPKSAASSPRSSASAAPRPAPAPPSTTPPAAPAPSSSKSPTKPAPPSP